MLKLLVFLTIIPKEIILGDPYPIGAKSWGMGNASVSIADHYAIFNNPAGLGFLKNNFISTAYHSRYEIVGLSTVAVAGNYISNIATIGLSFQRFGDKLYNETLMGFAVAKAINQVALGCKINYFQTAIDNLGSRNTLFVELGVMTKLSSKIQLGFHAYNVLRTQLNASQPLPSTLKLGLNFMPSKQILLATEIQKTIAYPTIITKFGLEYQFIPQAYFRTGFSSELKMAHFGLGYTKNNFIFDYAASSSQALGLSHHIGLSYNLNKP